MNMNMNMKNHLRALLSVAAISGLASPLADATGFFGQDTGNPELTRVSEAYLAGDLGRMAVEIKNALAAQPNDPVVRENVLGLLRKAYETAGQNGIPADWHLPDEITKMKITVRTAHKDLPEYTLKVYGDVTALGVIRQLRVTRFPDQVVLDKLAKVGEFEDSVDSLDKTLEYNYESPKSHQPVPTGLYLLHIELASGKATEGWFIVDDDMNATATPDVAAPAVGETFATGNPTFRWTNFQSPQYKPYEMRALWMGVSTSEPPAYDWNKKWELYERNPTVQEATVGVTAEGQGVSKLENGRYLVVIDYHERKRFGDVLIGRDCATSRQFTVKQ